MTRAEFESLSANHYNCGGYAAGTVACAIASRMIEGFVRVQHTLSPQDMLAVIRERTPSPVTATRRTTNGSQYIGGYTYTAEEVEKMMRAHRPDWFEKETP